MAGDRIINDELEEQMMMRYRFQNASGIYEDRLDIMHKVDSDVLARISTSMVQSITPYDAKKK